jgi:hypothetical protein
MDIIEFLKRGQLSILALRSAYAFLSTAQVRKGYVDFDEIHQGLLLGADLCRAEIDAHSQIIYGECNLSLFSISLHIS